MESFWRGYLVVEDAAVVTVIPFRWPADDIAKVVTEPGTRLWVTGSLKRVSDQGSPSYDHAQRVVTRLELVAQEVAVVPDGAMTIAESEALADQLYNQATAAIEPDPEPDLPKIGE
jgi:hypothetical protein